MCKICLVEANREGTIIQICNCKHGEMNCVCKKGGNNEDTIN